MPTPAKLQVVQAYDRAPIAEIDTDDAASLEQKLATATQVLRDRKGWLPVHARVDVLRKLAELMGKRRDHFARLIAQEGGKPLADATVETTRAIDGVRNAHALRLTQLHGDAGGWLTGVSWRETRTAVETQHSIRNLFLFVGADPETARFHRYRRGGGASGPADTRCVGVERVRRFRGR